MPLYLLRVLGIRQLSLQVDFWEKLTSILQLHYFIPTIYCDWEMNIAAKCGPKSPGPTSQLVVFTYQFIDAKHQLIKEK